MSSTSLAQLQNPTQNHAPVAMSFFDVQGFELMQRIAKAFATSDLVPKAYQGNLPNCMLALDMAQRMGMNPLMVMQNLYVVHGSPSWSAKFLVATANTCGRFSALRYEWKGEPGKPDFGCRAWAIEKDSGERLDGIWVTWNMVNSEGWASKSGSKWKTMPDQMFVYRAATFWVRAYAPELSMGLQTAEEVHDVYDAGRGSDGTWQATLDDLATPGRIGSESEQVDTTTGEITPTEPEPTPEAEPEKEQAPKTTRKAKPEPEPQPEGEEEFSME